MTERRAGGEKMFQADSNHVLRTFRDGQRISLSDDRRPWQHWPADRLDTRHERETGAGD